MEVSIENITSWAESGEHAKVVQAFATENDDFVRVATKLLVGAGEDAVPFLCDALAGDPNQAVRHFAALTLMKSKAAIRHPDAVAQLIAALDDVTYVNGAAAQALGRLKDDAAVAPLCAALANSDNPEARRRAAESLGKLKNHDAIPSLIDALDADSNEFVRVDATVALAKFKDERVIPTLVKILNGELSRTKEIFLVQRAAAEALHRRGDVATQVYQDALTLDGRSTFDKFPKK